MDAIATGEAGDRGRYASGLIALPDGRRCGIEEIVRVQIRAAQTPARVSDVAGVLRSARR